MASKRLINQINFVCDIVKLVEYSGKLGILLTFGEAYRTQDQQNIHLQNKKTTVKHSRHQDRLAIDFNFFIVDGGGNVELSYENERLNELGVFWEGLRKGNIWGGFWKTFKDTPHFEFNENKAI